MTINTRAVVKLTIEIPLSDNWNEDTDIKQIHAQALSSAVGKIRNHIQNARIIGEPIITMILVDKV